MIDSRASSASLIKKAIPFSPYSPWKQNMYVAQNPYRKYSFVLKFFLGFIKNCKKRAAVIAMLL
jgi:hypothetical protein